MNFTSLSLSNALLKDRAEKLRTLFNSDHTMRIFANDFIPTPASVLADFTEASFTGYSPVPMLNKFKPPAKIKDGIYEIAAPGHVFLCTGGPPQTVYGVYLSNGIDVQMFERFSKPIIMDRNSVFSVSFRPQLLSEYEFVQSLEIPNI